MPCPYHDDPYRRAPGLALVETSTTLADRMKTVPFPFDVDVLSREADQAAGRLVRQFRLSHHERDDIRQDLAVDLLARLKWFDSARGTFGAFVATVVAHRAVRLANRIRREQAVFAPISTNDPIPGGGGLTLGDTIAESDGYLALHGQPTDRIAETEHRLVLERALASLPAADIRFVTALAEASPTVIGWKSSRAGVYRRIAHTRLDLMAAGLAPA
jgi:hypothetical protein